MITDSNNNQERLQDSKVSTRKKKKKKRGVTVVQDSKSSLTFSSSANGSLPRDELSTSQFSNDTSSKPHSYHMEDFECLYQNEDDTWFSDFRMIEDSSKMPENIRIISPGSKRMTKGGPIVSSSISSNNKKCHSTSNQRHLTSPNNRDPSFNPIDVFKQIDDEQSKKNLTSFGNIRRTCSPEVNQLLSDRDTIFPLEDYVATERRTEDGYEVVSPSTYTRKSDPDHDLIYPISENERNQKPKTTNPDLWIQDTTTTYAAIPQSRKVIISNQEDTRIAPNQSLDVVVTHREVTRQYPYNHNIKHEEDVEKAVRTKFSSFPVDAVGSIDETSMFPGTLRQSFVSEQFSNECMTLEVVEATPVIDNGYDDYDNNYHDDNHHYPICIKDEIVYVDSSPLTLQTVLQNNKSIRRCFILSILIVIVVTIIVTLIIVKGAQNEFIEQVNNTPDDWDRTTVPSSAPTFLAEEVLNAAAEVSGWSALDSVGSPQFRAVGWMSSIDKVSIEKFGPVFRQRYSLVVFYFSTGGTYNWINQENWLNPTLHECDWSQGIQCTLNDSEMRVVIGIDATRNGLSGTLPDELKLFTDLEFLHLPKNSLSGVIPIAIGTLVKISSLDLSLNKFSGSIPQVIGNASSLVFLDLSHNSITGTIPKDLYTLTLLETLEVSWNAISGPITDDMENLHKLVAFDVRHNNLVGMLPKALTILTALDYILLDDNVFTGTLPKLSMAMGKLTQYFLSSLRYVAQTIPFLARRLEISLNNNLLTGTLPLDRFERYLQNENMESPFRIKKLDISFNLLTGTVNPIAPLIPSLKYFDLSHNRLQGQVRRSSFFNYPKESSYLTIRYTSSVPR